MVGVGLFVPVSRDKQCQHLVVNALQCTGRTLGNTVTDRLLGRLAGIDNQVIVLHVEDLGKATMTLSGTTADRPIERNFHNFPPRKMVWIG